MTRDDFAAAILPILIQTGNGVPGSSNQTKQQICEAAWKWADMMMLTREVDDED